MDLINFLRHRGFYIHKNFLKTDLCTEIGDRMRSVSSEPGHVYDIEKYILNQNYRKVQQTQPKEQIEAFHARLMDLKPILEAHFHLEISHCQTPQFLLYRPGDFYRPHSDNIKRKDAEEAIRERKISIVIFLNDSDEHQVQQSYTGGALTFHDLFKDLRGRKYVFPLDGETGLLVAFRSDIIHEVKPVTWGERLTIVSWFV